MNDRTYFFIGKGGVGKSTTSALTALNLAHCGHNTLLVSMDPAHNQRDIFQHEFSEKPKQVVHNLAIKEVDIDHWMSTYLKGTESQLKKAYSYQSAFNIQNYYNILKFSPGLEEYALLLAFNNTVQRAEDKDIIVFDMPPTALTLRFFSLPFITLVWLQELLKLRTQISEKKEIVSRIKLGKKEFEQDRVKARLRSLIGDHQNLIGHFTADKTLVNLILNNDHLSLSEAIRIRQKLTDIGIQINAVILNKVKGNEVIPEINTAFNGYKMMQFPYSSRELYGTEALVKYILENNLFSESIIGNLIK